MKDIRQRLLATFQIEHRDHVEQIRSLLAMIEKTADQPQGTELDEAFRHAHSLKGAARAVDLHIVEGLAHRLETLFSRVRQGVLPLDQSVTGVVQQALDASEDCVMALGNTSGDPQRTPEVKPALRALEEILKIEPEPGGASQSETRPAAPIPAFQSLQVVRISTHNFDGLLRSAGGLISEGQRQTQLAAYLQTLVQQIASLEKEASNVPRDLANSLGSPRIRSYLDATRRRTREIARHARSVCRVHQRSARTINRLGKQLQLDVWRARMVPAESLLEGYRKMMRDLARDEGKVIEFQTTNTGVHADRRVLEALKDPLLHLLRNAVSHGIELSKDRVENGKPAAGLVLLRIASLAQRLTITVEDNGRGVDFERVREVAVRRGIISESEATSCSPQRLANILFQPGFSTSRSVTELSGRGMGLSVVDEVVRRLHGSVEFRPRDGGGSIIELSVPLSISAHKLLLVSSGGQLFALPIHTIERLHRVRLDCISTIEGKPVMIVDRQPVPLFSLHQALDLRSSPSTDSRDVLPVAILSLKTQRVAVTVDAFLWESDAVIQDLGSAAQKGISGAVLLDDGQVAMVLNPEELIETSSPHEHLFPKPVVSGQEQPSILVVDDSMTTRTLEKSILEAHGYRVRVAVDGLEALEYLSKEKTDLVITDVQMPRMDGFGLLEAMKKDRELSAIPVIVVTSLDRHEDQERGLQLGAGAYVVKRKFDQAELLAAIRQIL